MQSMSDDDAAYSALLAQLLNDSATTRNARVHSWIEHQYDFVLSEQSRISSRPPSPSPSSSLGAHRTLFIDRPDSPLLPRVSSDRPDSPCPSYDALFFPPSKSDSNDFEEQERVRALRFIVQEMAHWQPHASTPSSLSSDKPLPAPPPSPASSCTQSISSRVIRSRSSSTRISRLPSFTSTLSSDQSHPQEIPPPLPVSVIVHGEFQHDLVLSRNSPIDGYVCTIPDDKDALHPSPTLSTFSSDSRDYPTLSPQKTHLFPPSPTSPFFPEAISTTDSAPHLLHTEHSQSRWSIATTASLAPSNSESKSSALLNPPTPPYDKKDKGFRTPRKRTRFISLISRLSPGRSDTSPNRGDNVDYDSANDSDSEDKDKTKQRKSLSKKSSLASLRASFSISRASFSSQRPPVSTSIEEIPPLPTSPSRPSPKTDVSVPFEASPSISRPSLSKIPSRGNIFSTPLPPIPQSASTILSFNSSSRASTESPAPLANASRVSLVPPPNKRTSLASAAGIEPMTTTNLVPARQATVRSKSIFRLTAKPRHLKAPISPETMMLSKRPLASSTSSTTVRSRIPQAPAKFIPPAKLATVIATQSRHTLVSPGPTSKLPMPPARIPPKVPPPITLPLADSRLPMPATTKGARVGTVKGFWKRQ